MHIINLVKYAVLCGDCCLTKILSCVCSKIILSPSACFWLLFIYRLFHQHMLRPSQSSHCGSWRLFFCKVPFKRGCEILQVSIVLYLLNDTLEVLFHYFLEIIFINTNIFGIADFSCHLVKNKSYYTFTFLDSFTTNLNCVMRITLFPKWTFWWWSLTNIT